MPKAQIRVAVIQAPPVFLNRDASLRLAVSLINDAADDGAHIVVFPETWLPGYPVWLDYAPGAASWGDPAARELYRLLYENAVDPSDLAPVCDAAAARRVTVAMGANERAGRSMYNTIFYCGGDGSILGCHRKLVPTHGERLVWGRGDGSTLTVVETHGTRLGGLICWEHWMPLARAAMHDRVECIHVAQWPYVKEMHQVASRHYAFEGRTFVVAAGCVLTWRQVMDGCEQAGASRVALDALAAAAADTSDPVLRGGSAIIGPSGAYLAGPVYDDPRTVSATIHPDDLIEESMTMDTSGHYARPDVFELVVDERPKRNVTLIREQDGEDPAGAVR